MADKLEAQGSVPVPDPTKLTTDAVRAAREEIEKLFDTKLTGFRELVTEKFAGRDTALAAALKSAQELVKQQNDSNTLAIDKATAAATKQIEAQGERIDDLKERIGELAGKNWQVVGAYIVGALGIAALIASALIKH
jgi:polyhydroxyalkanoate synthesis regulator phasin